MGKAAKWPPGSRAFAGRTLDIRSTRPMSRNVRDIGTPALLFSATAGHRISKLHDLGNAALMVYGIQIRLRLLGVGYLHQARAVVGSGPIGALARGPMAQGFRRGTCPRTYTNSRRQGSCN